MGYITSPVNFSMMDKPILAELSSKLIPVIIFIIGLIISPLQALFLLIDYVFLGPLYKKIAFWSGLASNRPYHGNTQPRMDTNGMPSSHVSMAFLLASMNGFPPSLTILAIMTALQRYYFGLHTPAQLIVGAAIGCASGYAFNYVINNKDTIKDYILGKSYY